jgi:hypothetical protein
VNLHWSRSITIPRILRNSCIQTILTELFQSPGPDDKHYYNEELVGKAIKIHGREKFVICTKFGISATRQVSLLSTSIV